MPFQREPKKMAARGKLIVVYLSGMTLSCWLSMISSVSTFSGGENLDRCGGRLERALDVVQRDSAARTKGAKEDGKFGDTDYREKLVSAPLEMRVSRLVVKMAEDDRRDGGIWARVETCFYEPKSNGLQTRFALKDLSVSGVMSLSPRDVRRAKDVRAESCRMSLRLRGAGIEFYTSPIARGRAQMRIRTESSFLEPRFASIYAYGCRPVRLEKQIKRHDKRRPQRLDLHSTPNLGSLESSIEETYEAAEPRTAAVPEKRRDTPTTTTTTTTTTMMVLESRENLGMWRKNDWITKISRRRKRRGSIENGNSSRSNDDDDDDTGTSESPAKNSFERETRLTRLVYGPGEADDQRRRWQRQFIDNHFDESPPEDYPETTGNIREAVSSETEDIFLRAASQALTRYIERQLHPAIKQTLMLSMGYTISYG